MMKPTLSRAIVCSRCISRCYSNRRFEPGLHSLSSSICISHTSNKYCLQSRNSHLVDNIRLFSEVSNLSNSTAEVENIKVKTEDFKFIELNVKRELETSHGELMQASQHHFDGAGKYVRPMIAMLMGSACNKNHAELTESQKEVATIVEMIHTASLVHDDVIDASNLRRGRHTVHYLWGQRKAVLAGNFILSTASRKLARIGNTEVVQVLSQVLEDLVTGEFMQLGSKEEESERFNHYMKKTYKKTASLIANSCKAVSILSDNTSPEIKEIAFQYGRNVGIAFQLIDDYLDFTASELAMGKPVCADLKLGLATAPVLYATMQYPELNAMIMRRFTEPGDVETARDLVFKSNGVEHTMFLAQQHCKEAVQQISKLENSRPRQALIDLTQELLKRTK